MTLLLFLCVYIYIPAQVEATAQVSTLLSKKCIDIKQEELSIFT